MTPIRTIRRYILLIPAILCGTAACTRRQLFERDRFLLDTHCIIKVVHRDARRAYDAIEAAFAETARVEALCGYASTSPVAAINRAAGRHPVAVDPELYRLIATALYFSSVTGSAFDITVGPLSELWGFRSEQRTVRQGNPPSDAQIRSALAKTGWRNVRLCTSSCTVFLTKPGMQIDLGGIAKGYAVQRAMDTMVTYGMRDVLINYGGDIEMLGRNAQGLPWKVGVQHPRHSDRIVTVISQSSGSIVTSGDYERYFFKDGVRYHHIFDPATGKPARGAISATVITNDNMIADILSTALFVLGPQKGIRLAESLPGVEAFIISESTAGATITLTANLRSRNLQFQY